MTIETKRLILRPFEESDYDDLFEFVSRLEQDVFEGYPGITYESEKKPFAQITGLMQKVFSDQLNRCFRRSSRL